MVSFGMLSLLLYSLCTWSMVGACNDLVCGPIVTKCQLLKACNCDMPAGGDPQDCKCCAACAACLEDKYPACCSCVGMCEPQAIADGLADSSSIGELVDPIPGLFTALTSSEEASNGMWSVVRYPAYESLLHHKSFGVTIDEENSMVQFSWDKQILSTVKMENCSVAFIKDCVPLARCKETCRSMGAAKFRWFHSGACCECVGDMCIDYGKNTPMCERCAANQPEEESADRLVLDEL